MSYYKYKAGYSNSTYWDNMKFPSLTAVKPDLGRTSCEKITGKSVCSVMVCSKLGENEGKQIR